MPVNHEVAKLFCRAVSNSSDFYLKPHFTQPILNLRTKVKWTFLLDLISFTVLTLGFLMLLLFPTLTDRNSAASGGKEKSVRLCNCKSAELNPGGQLGVSPVQRFLKCSCIKYSFMKFMLQACMPQCTEEPEGLCLMYLSVLFFF